MLDLEYKGIQRSLSQKLSTYTFYFHDDIVYIQPTAYEVYDTYINNETCMGGYIFELN